MEIRILLIGALILTSQLHIVAQTITNKSWSYKSISVVSDDLLETTELYSAGSTNPKLNIGENELIFSSDGSYSSRVNNLLTLTGTWKIEGSDFIMGADTMAIIQFSNYEIKLKGPYKYLTEDGSLKGGSLWISYASVSPPLPVKLVSFRARKSEEMAELTWQTSSEMSAYRYEIEQGEDLKSFKAVGIVDASGTSSSVTNYTYLDSLPANYRNLAQVYYRLRLVDLDGSYSFSRVEAVRLGQNEAEIVCHPNPFGETLQINSAAAQSATLTDNSGKTILKLNLKQGANMLNGTDISPGFYLLKTENNQTFKLVKY